MAKRVLGEAVFLDDLAVDEVFLDDALEDFRRAGVVPGALGIDDRDGAACANAEAVGLGAVHFWLETNEAEFLEPCFQERPRLEAGRLGAALRLGLVGTEKNVALKLFQPKRRRDFFKLFVRHGLLDRL